MVRSAVAVVAIGVLLVAAVLIAVVRYTRASRTPSVIAIDANGKLFTKADRRRMLKGQRLGGSSASTATNASEWVAGSTGAMSVDDMTWDDGSSAGGSVFFLSPGRVEPGLLENTDESPRRSDTPDGLEHEAPARPIFI